EEVVACRACDLHKQRIYPVVGRGPEKVRLMIVGDWLSAGEEGGLPPGQLFGVEQDRMLARMLSAINLPVEEVFIGNVIKCAVPAIVQPQAVHVQSCVSYLRRQIVALAPEAILAMGMVAARVILEKSQPLSRLRGRFHDFEAAPGVRIPVLVTYHPTYLLQNPEMKAATWADLQLLARQ
ncbi:MAG TPA: uracil-DNA glycosylase, partial [Desulfobulbaceae bacterium]|nr:uracil-DNA glycosylase [Desulfobulbaceae bacterium]